MADRRVLAVITARPSYARVATVITAAKTTPGLDLQVIATASALLPQYGAVADALDDTAERVETTVGTTLPAMVTNTTAVAEAMVSVFRRRTPDAVVTIADRHETLGTAMAAAYLNIPLIHLQAGERTGSIDDKVRDAVTALADVKLCATQAAADRVSGVKTGCPSIDLVEAIWHQRPVNPYAYGGLGPQHDLSRGYRVGLFHPVTTEVDEAHDQMRRVLHGLPVFDLPWLWIWPGLDAGTDAVSKALREHREEAPGFACHYFRHLPAVPFLWLLSRARVLVGNSSVGIRECSAMGLPVVNIGSRQQGRERGPNVVDVPVDAGAIRKGIDTAEAMRPYPVALYGDGHSGPRIARLLADGELR